MLRDSAISAQPTVELRPAGGLEVVIRYITRVQDRFEMRSKLNQRLLAILHAPQQNGYTLQQTLSSEIESPQTV